MVNVTTFKDKHLDIVRDMHISHDYEFMGGVSKEGLPKIGFISYSNTEYQYVAAGFLRMVEGGYAQIDSLVSNPSLSSDIRNEGINIVVEKLIEKAKSMNLKGIYAFTVDNSILERAMVCGFSLVNHKVLVKPL